MSPDVLWLFGERGLAAVERPTLIMVGSEDVGSPYEMAVEIFRHLPEQPAGMITFVRRDHMDLLLDPADLGRMHHFATAFFGYHLQGRHDLADSFSADLVNRQDGLAWGVYEGQ
jgi:pimeloyl-ACP methyl ester carboxylesterase